MTTLYVSNDSNKTASVDYLNTETDTVTYTDEANKTHNMQWCDFIKTFSGLVNDMIEPLPNKSKELSATKPHHQ